jgi:hypothetical protein
MKRSCPLVCNHTTVLSERTPLTGSDHEFEEFSLLKTKIVTEDNVPEVAFFKEVVGEIFASYCFDKMCSESYSPTSQSCTKLRLAVEDLDSARASFHKVSARYEKLRAGLKDWDDFKAIAPSEVMEKVDLLDDASNALVRDIWELTDLHRHRAER